MKILKYLKTGEFKKIVLCIFLGILSLYVGVFIYSLVFEQDKISIDRYNFEQLEKTKPILKSISKTDKKFYSLKEFNKRYNAEIRPKKNCYYVSNDNGDYSYIFGFQLESLVYKLMYFGRNYTYPKYNLPYDKICYGICNDRNKIDFEYTISNPCED